jgi:hypothetical protein
MMPVKLIDVCVTWNSSDTKEENDMHSVIHAAAVCFVSREKELKT